MEDATQKNPLVSVIIPTYNRTNVLQNAINSVFSQTFTDWELVIIDDGSTDDTWEVLQKLVKENNKIKIFRHEKNKGVSASRNTGIKNTEGQYLAFLDSDDEWLPEKLEKQVNIFKKGESSLGLVYTSAIFINKNLKESRVKIADLEGNIYKEELAYNPIGGTSRVMIKKECVDECGYFDESIRCNEDWDLWIRITSKYSVACENTPQVRYFEASTDSLSLNGDYLISGYKTIWDKYKILSMPAWILAAHYVRLGHRLFYFGITGQGREYLQKAVTTEPWNPKHAILLLASYLGKNFYRKFTFLIMKNILKS